jgi:drug/metabolite transporter (DMT)-like permease
MVSTSQKRIRGIVLVLLANLIWGTSAFLVKFFPRLDAISLVWARSIFGAIITFLWLIFFIKPFSRVTEIKKNLKELFLLSLTFIGTVGFMTAGVQYGTVTSAIFLLYTAPIFVAVFAKFFLKERVREKDLIPLGLASIALVFIFGGALGQKVMLGDVFGLLGGVSWGLQIILGKKIGQKVSGYISSFWMITMAVFLLAPFTNYPQILQSNLILLALYGAVNNGLAPLAFFEGIRFTTAKQAGILSLIDPIENSLLALLFFKEIPTLGTFIGAFLILLSMVVQAIETEERPPVAIVEEKSYVLRHER